MTNINMSRVEDIQEKLIKEGKLKIQESVMKAGEAIEQYKEEQKKNLKENIELAAKKILIQLKQESTTYKEVIGKIEQMKSEINQINNTDIRRNCYETLIRIEDCIEEEIKSIPINVGYIVEETKNIDGDTVMQTNEDSITVNGVLKINQEQEQKMGVINYLPAETMKCNLDPRFICQVTEEVIKKMKELSFDFKELPIESKIKLDSKDVRKVENSSDTATKNSKTLTVENILGNNEKAMKKIKEAMELIHENINMIMNGKSMNRTATAILEDLMSSERQLLSTLVHLRITNDKQTR